MAIDLAGPGPKHLISFSYDRTTVAQALHLSPFVQSRPSIASHAKSSALRLVLSLVMCAWISACRGDHNERPVAQVSEAQVAHLLSALGLHLQGALHAALQPAPEALSADAPAQVSSVANLEVRVPDAPDGTQVHLLSGVSLDAVTLATDTSGVARFDAIEVGHYQVWAASPGLASDLVTITMATADDARPQDLDLRLRPATVLRARIRDEAGQGLAARLTLIPIDHEHAPLFVDSAADGIAHVPSLPRGRWRAQVSAKTHTLAQAITIAASDAEQEIDLELVKNASLVGRVVSAQGDPVADAMVRITRVDAGESKEPGFVTGAGPRWVHPLPGKRQMPLRDTRRFGAARDGLRPLECGAGHCGVDIGGKRGWPVLAAADGVVIVSSRDDRGKAGRYVALAHQNGFRSFYMHLDSIAEPVFVGARIPAGTQLGTLGRSGVLRSEPHLHFALSRQETEQSYFVDPEPMLSFAVLLALPHESSGLSDVLVADVDSDPLASSSAAVASALRSDARGRFAVSDLAPGTYLVHVVHPHLAPGYSSSFTLKPGQRLDDLQIALATGQALLGRVLGVRGKAPGAWVRAYQGEGESRQIVARAQADAEGFFALRPLVGDIELEAGAPGFGVETRNLSLGADRPEPLAFDLPAFDSQLRGQILDPLGGGVAGAIVQVLEGPGARGRRITTDGDGHFRLDTVPAGHYRVRVRSDRFPVFEGSVAANESSDLRLAQGGALRLALRDQHSGQALAALRVQAKGPDGQRTTGISDKDGRVSWPALAAGTWKISVTDARYTSLNTRIRVEASEEDSVLHELALSQGATLGGILRDGYGERVAGARVWLDEVETTTDADGRFRLEQVSSGDVQLRAEMDDVTARLPLTLFAGDEYLTLDLRLD